MQQKNIIRMYPSNAALASCGGRNSFQGFHTWAICDVWHCPDIHQREFLLWFRVSQVANHSALLTMKTCKSLAFAHEHDPVGFSRAEKEDCSMRKVTFLMEQSSFECLRIASTGSAQHTYSVYLLRSVRESCRLI